MPENNFKLTPEMIVEIEEKVNNCLDDVHNGMKERLSHLCDPSITACWVIVNVFSENVNVIDPIQSYEDEEECEDFEVKQ
jgi:hypothetical protein